MSETAARQSDRVLPVAPYRQWVLALPWELRLPVAPDPALLNAVSRVFFEELRVAGAGRACRGRGRDLRAEVRLAECTSSPINLSIGVLLSERVDV